MYDPVIHEFQFGLLQKLLGYQIDFANLLAGDFLVTLNYAMFLLFLDLVFTVFHSSTHLSFVISISITITISYFYYYFQINGRLQTQLF